MSTRTLPQSGSGRRLWAAAFAATILASWMYGQMMPPSGPGGGMNQVTGGGQIKIDRSSAQQGMDPQPYAGKIDFAPDAVLVAFQPGASARQRADVIARNGLQVDPTFRPNAYFARLLIRGAQMTSPTSVVEDKVANLKRESAIRIAEPDFRIRPDQALPNDAEFGQQWGLHNTGQSGGTADADIDWPEAQPYVSGAPVTVAVCDDGVDYSHPDLAANVWSNPGEIAGNLIDDDGNGYIDDTRGWDFASNDNDPMPASGDQHGTHVAGTVGAVTNNSIGVAGSASNVRVMCMRMYSGQSTWMSALIQSIDYARLNGAKVISVSYNIDGYTQLLVEAIQRAGTSDVVYCNSAGNNSQNIDSLRGAIRNVAPNSVFVASIDRNDVLSSFSNFGNTVEIAAPGSDIISTIPGATYAVFSGTSMATPHMAGAVATVRSKYPSLTARQALDRLIGTADHPATLTGINGGRLNLSAALDDDSVAPSDPANVRNTHYSSEALKVLFQGSGDDGTAGMASSYDIRVSESPITAGNFSSARRVNASIDPVPAGGTAACTVAGLAPGKAYFVAVQAIDNVGNRSGIAVCAAPMSTRPLPIIEDSEGAGNFTAISGPWAITNTQYASPTHSWTDSPGGVYGNNLNIELRSNASYPVNGMRFLRFNAKIDLESGYDYAYIDVSADNGATWVNLGRLNGTADWKAYSYSLSAFANQSVRVRFRMTTDGSVTKDGIYIDDLYFAPATVLYGDDMESSASFGSSSGWGWVTDKSSSPTHSWTDSPAGAYGNNASNTLDGVPVINVDGYANPSIAFNAWVDLENNYDYLHVLGAKNGGSYSTLGQITGIPRAWGAYSFPLGDATTVRLGFRMTSDSSVTNDGVWVDDVKIIGEKWYGIKDPKPRPNE